MDGTLAINNNLQALKRILAGLVAMAGLGCLSSPLAGEDGSARQGKAEPLAEPGEGSFSGNHPTLPRHLRLAILRLLRPAESAARRLIIAAARGLTVTLPPPRPFRPKPASPEPMLRRFGIAVTLSPSDVASAILPRSRGRGTGEAGGGGARRRTRPPPPRSAPPVPPECPPHCATARRSAHPPSRHCRPACASAAAVARRPDRRHAPHPAPRRPCRRARRYRGAGQTLRPLAGAPQAASPAAAAASGRCVPAVRPAGVSRATIPRPSIPAASARSTRSSPTPTRWPSMRCSAPTRHERVVQAEPPSTMLRMVPLPRFAGEDKLPMSAAIYAQVDKPVRRTHLRRTPEETETTMPSGKIRAGQIRAGMGGWTFEPWEGTFYPEKLAKKKQLEFASRAVPTIEVNGTYYSGFTPDTYAKWAAETPRRFRLLDQGQPLRHQPQGAGRGRRVDGEVLRAGAGGTRPEARADRLAVRADQEIRRRTISRAF